MGRGRVGRIGPPGRGQRRAAPVRAGVEVDGLTVRRGDRAAPFVAEPRMAGQALRHDRPARASSRRRAAPAGGRCAAGARSEHHREPLDPRARLRAGHTGLRQRRHRVDRDRLGHDPTPARGARPGPRRHRRSFERNAPDAADHHRARRWCRLGQERRRRRAGRARLRRVRFRRRRAPGARSARRALADHAVVGGGDLRRSGPRRPHEDRGHRLQGSRAAEEARRAGPSHRPR